jgi:hypothetical protein
MEDKEADISIHHPPTRVTLILNLVVGPEMPLAVDLATPERIVVACIRWPDLSRVVCTTLSRDPPVLHLDVFARGTLLCVTVHVCWPGLPDRPRGGCREALWLAVRNLVGRGSCTWSRWIDMCRIAVARYRVVVSPLVGVIEVSKWIQRAIQVVVVVAIATAIGGVRIVGGIVGLGEVIGGVGLGVQGTGVVYRRLVGGHSVSDTHTDTNASKPTVAIAASYDAGGRGAIRSLAGIGEETTLAVTRVVDVLVAGLWECLHCNDWRSMVDRAMSMTMERWRRKITMVVGWNREAAVGPGEIRKVVKVEVRSTRSKRRWCCGSKFREPRDVQDIMRANEGGVRQRCSKG